MKLHTLVGVALFACATLVQAEQVEAPAIHIGDSWTFDKIDGWKKSKDFTRVTTVTALDDKEIRTESKTSGEDGTLVIVRTRELNEILRDTGSLKNTQTPYMPTFSFPLEVGKTWSKEFTTARSNAPNDKSTSTLTGNVVGREQVTVPAGIFDAFKIEVKGRYNRSTGHGSWSGELFHTIWYVPEVRYFVKWIYRDTGQNGRTFNHEIYELTSYKLNP